MWDWAWQPPEDYGTRYDFGLLETCRVVLDRFALHNEREPSEGWLASKLLNRLVTLKHLPKGTVIIDQREWLRSEGHSIGGVGETGRWELTRGAIAACWGILTSEHADTVMLVGCDNLRLGVTLPAEQAFCETYIANPGSWGLKGYHAGVTKDGNHDFIAERRLLEKMAAKRGVALSFAQDAWAGPKDA